MSDFLVVEGFPIPVAAASAADVEFQDVGGEVVRAYAGNLLSSVKAHARVWRVATAPMVEADARYMLSLLRSPWALPCSGRYIGGPTSCMVRALRSRAVAVPGGARWTVEFELHETTSLPPDGNLLRNPGFEEGAAYWNAAAGRSYLSDPAVARTGHGYLEMFAASGQFLTSHQDAPVAGAIRYFPVRPGDVVSFGAWVQRITGDAFTRVRLAALDASLGDANFSNSTIVDAPTWTLSEGIYTVPEGKAFVYFSCQIATNNTTGTTARFDDCFLRIQRAGA